jgi:hypothetical protein
MQLTLTSIVELAANVKGLLKQNILNILAAKMEFHLPWPPFSKNCAMIIGEYACFSVF